MEKILLGSMLLVMSKGISKCFLEDFEYLCQRILNPYLFFPENSFGFEAMMTLSGLLWHIYHITFPS